MNQSTSAPDNREEFNRRLDRKLNEARKELLETSTRSRLLHTPLGSSRAKIIEVHDELAEQIFRILVRDGKSMSFIPSAEDIDADQLLTTYLPQPEEDEVGSDGLAARHTDSKLQTTLPSATLQARLRSVAYDAHTIESEQGVNVLYLALGFLKWTEIYDRKKPRYAPLVLVPVTLTRSNASERFRVAYSGEEISTNLSLKQRLKEEGVDLPDLPDQEDISPDAYAAAVSQNVAGVEGWEVLPDRIALGFFSFAKLMMYRDLDPDLWPATDGLRDNRHLSGLLLDGFRAEQRPLVPDDVAIDPLIDIAAAPHVVDADSSQMLAIEDVRTGNDLVIQGPPGTGKSQTITNLIASAVREGKTVLFVAEKMAALNVVRNNLDQIGLGEMCLELHSHRARKKAVLEDLEQTYQFSGHSDRTDTGLADKLRAARDALNDHVKRIHERQEPSGRTPFEVFSRLALLSGRGIPPPDFQLLKARDWTTPDIEDRTRIIERIATHVASMGQPSQHPWKGTGLDIVLPQDAERIGAQAQELHKALAELADLAFVLGKRAGVAVSNFTEMRRIVLLGETLAQAPGFDPTAIGHNSWSTNRSEISEIVEQGLIYANVHLKLDSILIPLVWDEDVSKIRRVFAERGGSLLRWLRRDYRFASRRFKELTLEPTSRRLPERLDILDSLVAGQQARQHIRAHNSLGSSAFGSRWLAEQSDWALLQAIQVWEGKSRDLDLPQGWQGKVADSPIPEFVSETHEFSRHLDTQIPILQRFLTDLSFDVRERFMESNLESVPICKLRDSLAAFALAPKRLQQWCIWRTWSRQAREKGLTELAERLEDGRLEPKLAIETFNYACFEALARQIYINHPDLKVFDGRGHESILADFQHFDRERLKLARKEVKARHVELIPKGDRQIGEIGILAREWRKQRRHLPLRQLISSAGRAMQLIKPVWMMSPMSLAQFVEPGSLKFDLVLMDEASQIRPVEALGSVARGRQLVVVGDDNQLPPTSFFERLVVDEDAEPTDKDEFRAADVESILGLCTAQGVPDRMLRWHYRSQHESLIAVSNLEFYKKLFIVPSAHSDGLGLRWRRVKGIYDRGRTATNRLEAQEVARAVLEHAKMYGRSIRFPEGMTLGVGTFSVAQRDAILDELELLRRRNPELETFFDPDAPEPFFVKNLESIQGDERDVVYISVGYGPDADGFVAMGFGPLSAQGGERRLNVLISRARRRCEVFSSITAANIDLARTQSIGVRVFKTFLHFAETGQLERTSLGPRPADSDFEEDVGMALAALNYQVEHQVGVAGFFVDLAIKDPEQPGRYMIGIECDGATYHGSRSARDRDRLREQVLRDRGWQIHRIWSLDWFNRRHEELQRAVKAIETARLCPPTTLRLPQGTEIRPDPGASETPVSRAKVPDPVLRYIEADFRVPLHGEPHELSLTQRISIVTRIVDVEGPVHEEEIARRFATICGKERAGNRIQEATRQALSVAALNGQLYRDGEFYSMKPIAEVPLRDRSATASLTLKKPSMIPPLEIRTGLLRIVEDHLGVEPEVAIVEVARMLGFQRTGQELQRVIEEQIRSMLTKGILRLRNGHHLYTPDGNNLS